MTCVGLTQGLCCLAVVIRLEHCLLYVDQPLSCSCACSWRDPSLLRAAFEFLLKHYQQRTFDQAVSQAKSQTFNDIAEYFVTQAR